MRRTATGSQGLLTKIALVVVIAAVSLLGSLGSSKAEDQPWSASLRVVSQALSAKNIPAAYGAWRDAYGVALGSRTWLGMVEVGDAALRIRDAASTQAPVYEAKARQAYLMGLLRARSQGSLDGMVRIAQAFEALGDREVVGRCVRIAERLALETHDNEGRARFADFAARLSDRSAAVDSIRMLP